MKKFIKQLLCKHDWETEGNLFISYNGATKVAHAHCQKCGKTMYYDIFSSFARKVKVNKNDNI